MMLLTDANIQKKVQNCFLKKIRHEKVLFSPIFTVEKKHLTIKILIVNKKNIFHNKIFNKHGDLLLKSSEDNKKE